MKATYISSSNVDSAPLISIISAVYNVSEYLPDYLASLDRQTIDPSSFEVILVDDGSSDRSADVIKDWMNRTELRASIIHKVNGGQASARNLGIASAKGDWLTFLDPDDFVADNYLKELSDEIGRNGSSQPSLYASRIVKYLESTKEYSNKHALHRRFRDGNRIVNLDRSPDFFHMSGPTALVQRRLVEKYSISFEEKLRFSFEDAHFVASYLLSQAEPTIGYVSTAEYYYRIRSAGTSSIQTGALRPEKYTDVLEHGHLNLIAQCVQRDRTLPAWLQYMLLYDIFWYFRGDRRVGAPSKQLPDDVLATFHRHIRDIVAYIDDESIFDFDVMPTDRDLRDALLLGYKYPCFRPQRVGIMEHDESRQMTKLEYIFSGTLPNEVVTYRGLRMRPVIVKTQGVPFFGRNLFFRRHIWIPSNGTFSMTLDDQAVSLEFGRQRPPSYRIRPIKVQRHYAHTRSAASVVRGSTSKNRVKRTLGLAEYYVRDWGKSLRGFLPQRRSHWDRLRSFINSPRTSAKYNKSWVFLDRINAANDNAEHLYRHILNVHPKKNAWFVLDRESNDWSRLESEGFRLLAYGSKEHFAALSHAEVYASSHLDRFITSPLPTALGVRPSWKFIFLQHGVTLHDQSAWFNSKEIDLLVTATNTEYNLIIEEGSKYKFTDKEVELTGFPRHDALRRGPTGSGRADQDKLIVLSLTWREGLTTKPDASGKRELSSEFSSSDYACGIQALISSGEFLDRLASVGYRVAYLPHPNMVMASDLLEIDPRVEILNWEDAPFAEIVARADIWVTDYSSTAFEAAYAGVPLVYYQPDQEDVRGGLHIYDANDYSFDDHGFGPVATDAETFLGAVRVLSSPEGREKYESRRSREFPFSGSGNSERVYQAIQRTLKRTRVSSILKELDG